MKWKGKIQRAHIVSTWSHFHYLISHDRITDSSMDGQNDIDAYLHRRRFVRIKLGEELMRRVCFGAWERNKRNELLRNWRRCTDCLLSEMKGVESHARDRSMDKMGWNDCL